MNVDVQWEWASTANRPEAWLSTPGAWFDLSEGSTKSNIDKFWPSMGPEGVPWVLCPSNRPLRSLHREWAEASSFLVERGIKIIGITLGDLDEGRVRAVLTGTVAGTYRYVPKTRVRFVIRQPTHVTSNMIEETMELANAQQWVRRLVDTPPNEKPPQILARRFQDEAPEPIKWTVLETDALRELGAGGILAVGQGSHRPPVLVVGRYQGGTADAPYLALVGKGVTFDSGGLSLKPTDAMVKMKADMAGSAAVMATLRLVAQRRWPVNILGIAGLVENLPGGGAYRPSDIITLLDGTRVEIITTDAEGRLVLGDGVAYAVQQGAAAIIDIATLTGANMVALGGVRASLVGNDETWTQQVRQAGDDVNELVWELPHDEEYSDLIHTRVADIKNSGGRPAGTITAALFVGHFAKTVPWAHIDMAGMALLESATPVMRQGPTGFGVSLLTQVVRSWMGRTPMDGKALS